MPQADDQWVLTLVFCCFRCLGIAGDHALDLVFGQMLSAHSRLFFLALARCIKITKTFSAKKTLPKSLGLRDRQSFRGSRRHSFFLCCPKVG